LEFLKSFRSDGAVLGKSIVKIIMLGVKMKEKDLTYLKFWPWMPTIPSTHCSLLNVQANWSGA
jgi:hypothetical protein